MTSCFMRDSHLVFYQRYEEKDAEWNNLTKLVEEQNHYLVFAKATQESSNLDSEKNLKNLQELEAQLSSLQEKHQVCRLSVSICSFNRPFIF